MTYVITTNNLDVSVTKTISVRKFCYFLGGFLIAAVGVGAAVGYGVAQLQEKANVRQIELSKSEYERKSLDYQQTLINHIGELSARIVNLELEAGSLAAKIGVVQEFEERMKLEKVALDRKSKAKPGAVGGPLIKENNNKKSSSKTSTNAAQNNKTKAAVKNKKTDVQTKEITPVTSDKLPEQTDIEPNTKGDVSLLDDAKKQGSIVNKINMDESFNQTNDIQSLVTVERNIDVLKQELANLEEYVSKVSIKHMFFPGRKPVINARISSVFGNRVDPIYKKIIAFHSGIDFAAPVGTPVYASAGGKVIFAGSRNAYGNVVEIDHGAGIVTRYAHTSQVLVKKEQMVMPGDLIAKVGNTGRSTGAHLHFEIMKDGNFVNPKVYLSRF